MSKFVSAYIHNPVQRVLPNTNASDEDIAMLSKELDGSAPDFFNGIDTCWSNLPERIRCKHMA